MPQIEYSSSILKVSLVPSTKKYFLNIISENKPIRVRVANVLEYSTQETLNL
jgi:hypothetical protein